MKNFEIYDISPIINSNLAVFPGDTPFELKTLIDFDNGNNFKLCSFQGTTHLGSHTDAPSHYAQNESGISDVPLDAYFGHCQVIDLSEKKRERIEPEDIKHIALKSERILFKTKSYKADCWTNDFTALSASLIAQLCKNRKIKLIGIDTPSVDRASDKILNAHTEIAKNNVAILEGIVLENIVEGEYYLSALPLKIEQGDSSPVRAILFKIKEDRQK